VALYVDLWEEEVENIDRKIEQLKDMLLGKLTVSGGKQN